MLRCNILAALVGAALVGPCTSLDRPLFVPSALVPGLCGGSAARLLSPAVQTPLQLQLQRAAPRSPEEAVRLRMSKGASGRRPDVDGRGGADELDLLKCALDRMELRGVRCQQLAVHEQAQLHRLARAVARNAAYLTPTNAKWAVTGRWRLVLAPQEWSWLLGFSPGADVLVDVDTEKETIDYAINFPNRWQLLQRLQWHARFTINAGACGTVQVLTFQILRLLAVVAGFALPLTVPKGDKAAGSLLTSYFDGDLWIDRSAHGLSVYRYAGPVPECDTGGRANSSGEGGTRDGLVAAGVATASFVGRLVAIAAMVACSMVLTVPLVAFTLVLAAAAHVLQRLLGLVKGSHAKEPPLRGSSSSSYSRPGYL